MWGRRFAYLCFLLVCFLLYLLIKTWFFWVLLMGLLFLPLLSLVLSLPAMCMVKGEFSCPEQVRMGVPAKTNLVFTCPFPMPPVRSKIRLVNHLSGERYVGLPGEYVPVKHCGLMEITWTSIRIYDYLGLFCWKRKKDTCHRLCIMPKPVVDPAADTMSAECGDRWVPKNGGFAEEHELRLYRPGDDLRLIHHKMTAKTGKIIYRQPMVRTGNSLRLVLTLSGSPKVLDRKLGQLLYISRSLLQKNMAHDVFCRTGKEDLHLTITDLDSQETAMKAILESPATTGEWIPEESGGIYRIGGQV